ncbi:MAG TPA: Holliday junction branch migration protein RuvA [Balneolales bacterium]|nr:Holliday junction branch migration protein RuvA [Balneolales bacterium]
MIAYLNGTLIRKEQNEIIVDVHGVGYRVGVSTHTFSQLPTDGSAIKLYTYHHFTDSDQRLFGFLNTGEQNLFELLITVKSVGPKLALTMLSGMKADEIIDIIIRKDAVSLSRIPGIGKKTAERIVLELKDKIDTASISSTAASSNQNHSDIVEEAIAALVALGYRKNDSEKTVMKTIRNNDSINSVSDLIRDSLKILNK